MSNIFTFTNVLCLVAMSVHNTHRSQCSSNTLGLLHDYQNVKTFLHKLLPQFTDVFMSNLLYTDFHCAFELKFSATFEYCIIVTENRSQIDLTINTVCSYEYQSHLELFGQVLQFIFITFALKCAYNVLVGRLVTNIVNFSCLYFNTKTIALIYETFMATFQTRTTTTTKNATMMCNYFF